MAKTILDQLATNRALYNATSGGNYMGSVSAIDALHSAALIQRQVANADGYSYSGGYYGSFVTSRDDAEIALDSSMMLQEQKIAYTPEAKNEVAHYIANSRTYNYEGGSYGNFIAPVDTNTQESVDALYVAQVIDGGVEAENKETEEPTTSAISKAEEKSIKTLLQKYKLWIIAAICTVLYFVLRKKE